MLPIRLECQAVCEFESAFEWYLNQSPSAGARFESTINDVFSKIQEHPHRFSKLKGKLRYYPVPGYPYRIIYRVLEQDIEVVAIAHNSRRPGYWRK